MVPRPAPSRKSIPIRIPNWSMMPGEIAQLDLSFLQSESRKLSSRRRSFLRTTGTSTRRQHRYAIRSRGADKACERSRQMMKWGR